MNVIRTYVPNSYENYNHLVFCPDTRKAAAVDPFDAQHLLQLIEQHQLELTQIWITHEHGDHIRQMDELKQATGATICAPSTCRGMFSADIWLEDRQNIRLGEHQLVHWLTPGHTPGHGIYSYQNQDQPELDFVICGDTLFNAGVGNTRSGNSAQLYSTIKLLSARMSKSSQIYSGHDYIVTNLNFTLHHLPDFAAAQQTLEKVMYQSPNERTVQRFEDELKHNLFLRLDSPEVMTLCDNSGLSEDDRRCRFIALRNLRDQW